MSESGAIIPLASYNLKLIPGIPTLAIDEDFPVSIRLTMAALDPTDPEGDEPSTLKIIKRPTDFPEDGIMYDSDEDDDEEEEEEEEPKEEKKKSKKGKKEESDEEMENDEEEDSDEDDDLSYEIEEYVLCTLSPKTGFQQTMDLVITADEDVMFEVSGSYPIHLTGNYIEHPYIDDDSEFDFDSEDEDELDDSDYDLSPDEDEVLPAGKILELSESESEQEEKPAKKEKKNKNKRAAEEETAAAEQTKSKKAKKSVEFNKELEQGPSGSDAKKTQKLEGGVIIEDRTVGEGPSAKNGDKVGMRYIGKLKNGNVFDSNTKGKPFYFGLGKGEVIKGWDIGVKGMKVKGERRIVIPAALAYGKQSLPGIPANSELTFDVKLVNIK